MSSRFEASCEAALIGRRMRSSEFCHAEPTAAGRSKISPCGKASFWKFSSLRLECHRSETRQARRPVLYESFSPREGFPGLGDGDQLVPRRLRSTVQIGRASCRERV